MFDFKQSKTRFQLPEGVVYLDGNSLGPPVLDAADRLATVVKDEWGAQLIKAWNTAGWMQRPRAESGLALLPPHHPLSQSPAMPHPR